MFKNHYNKLAMIVASQVREDYMFFARKTTNILQLTSCIILGDINLYKSFNWGL